MLISNNIVFKSIKRSFGLLPDRFRKQSTYLFLGILINSFLDLIGLAAILPLLAAILQEGFIADNIVLSTVYRYLGFTETRWFIVFLCVLILGFVSLKNIFGLWVRKQQLQFSWEAYESISSNVLKSAYSKGYAYFNNQNSNHLMNQISGVPLRFSQTLLAQLFLFMNELVVIVLVVFSLFVYDFRILLILIMVIIPIFYFFYKWSKDRLSVYLMRLNDLTPAISKPIFEIVFGYVDVVVGNVFEKFRAQYLKGVSESKKIRVKAMVIEQIPNRLVEVCVIIAVITMLLYGVFILESSSKIITMLSVFALAAYRSIPSINRLMMSLVNIKGQEFQITLLEKFLPFDFDELKKSKLLVFEKQIRLKNLSFQFSDANTPIINQLDLVIERGEVLGIVGKSGSGKTTLMNILLGFLEKTAGSIFIDNEELTAENITSWQQKIGYVRQDVFLIDGTVRDNIAFGLHEEEVDEEKLEEVIKKAQLEEVVNQLSKGIETNIGERGAKVSGGQRQRIGIARALYHNAEVLFFDEATSALDIQTETEITEAIHSLKSKDLTVVIIAHRASTLKYCDRIIDLSK